MNREERINKFLEAWNEAMTAVAELKEEDNFKFQFDVTISSSNEDATDRVKLIEGINQSFRAQNWRYSTQI
jgi:hypothetical protein